MDKPRMRNQRRVANNSQQRYPSQTRRCPQGSVPPILQGSPGNQRPVCPLGTIPSQDQYYDLIDQYGKVYVPGETTHIKRRHIRLILLLTYILTLIVMVVDLYINITEVVVFYALTNAILLFRVYGVFWLTRLLHVITFLILIIMFITLDYAYVNTYNALCCIVPVAVLMLLSLHMVLFRPGRSVQQRATRASCHALLGLMVVIVHFWVCCFLINFHNLQCILEMFYMFLFLLIVLTPHFQSRSQAVVIAKRQCPRPTPIICPSPHCCIPDPCYTSSGQRSSEYQTHNYVDMEPLVLREHGKPKRDTRPHRRAHSESPRCDFFLDGANLRPPDAVSLPDDLESVSSDHIHNRRYMRTNEANSQHECNCPCHLQNQRNHSKY